ncbi:2-phosphosulfolactate phosphatase [Allokutzneria sp. A3M-2-11 16]|uniref:2-phosphosulfolactate phosphatase n=1 Tax=Allokutzneria sp. A3M-2-11 16 TaxID=2962043 RepID=UPI0020B7D88B|nr:2-phosphosulfolactate phosphatase [Allokutzneria sp. A3M-2-11 16]MCP3800908.1 2-phosphosulfolactate phosphatase [Allokutzneria sp. A3M-2-11 16]
MDAWFRQDGYQVRLEWGLDGVTALGADCAVLVIVDVLSFTTSVDIAVGRGARIMPLRWKDEAAAANARRAGLPVGEAFGDKLSLRPSSLVSIEPGTTLALPSANGATLCDLASKTSAQVLTGCLRNADAVAARARELAGDRPIGLIAGGERWRLPGDPLRPCWEDLLGAGAIISALPSESRSPEAEMAARTYRATGASLLRECVGAKELIAAGYPDDVRLATEVNVSTATPLLTDGVLS